MLLGKWRITLLFDGWKAHLAVLPTKRKYKMATIEEQIKALEKELAALLSRMKLRLPNVPFKLKM
mgnify:CR=1 FL=1